jgi:hypothetical protein
MGAIMPRPMTAVGSWPCSLFPRLMRPVLRIASSPACAREHTTPHTSSRGPQANRGMRHSAPAGSRGIGRTPPAGSRSGHCEANQRAALEKPSADEDYK